MNDNSVRETIKDLMEEADIVVREGQTLSYFDNGREYLILISVVDITDWNKTSDED